MRDDLFHSPKIFIFAFSLSQHCCLRTQNRFASELLDRFQMFMYIHLVWTSFLLFLYVECIFHNDQHIHIMTLWPKSLDFLWTNAFDTFVAILITNNATVHGVHLCNYNDDDDENAMNNFINFHDTSILVSMSIYGA